MVLDLPVGRVSADVFCPHWSEDAQASPTFSRRLLLPERISRRSASTSRAHGAEALAGSVSGAHRPCLHGLSSRLPKLPAMESKMSMPEMLSLWGGQTMILSVQAGVELGFPRGNALFMRRTPRTLCS